MTDSILNGLRPILMNQAQAAAYLGTTVGTLNTWRHLGKNPVPYMRWGNRIRYRKEDLDAWIASRVVSFSDNQKEI